MMKNKDIVDLSKATHAGSGVTLSIEEADKFIDYLEDLSVLTKNARIERMTKPEKNINAVGFETGQFLYPAETFSSSDYKTDFDGNQIKLTTKKLRGCVAIFDDDKEDYKAQPNLDWNATILKLIAKKVANQIEEIAWISDTQSLGGFAATDPRSLFDGWRYQINNSQSGETYENDVIGSAVILDASIGSGGADFDLAGAIAVKDSSAPYAWEFKYKNMLKAMDPRYARVAAKDLRFWNHDKLTLDYNGAVADRATVAGDNALIGNVQNVFSNTPIVSAPGMSITLNSSGVHGGGSYSDSLLTPAKNLIWGIQRSLTLEFFRDAAGERDLWFYSVRMDFAVENVNACVLTKNVTY